MLSAGLYSSRCSKHKCSTCSTKVISQVLSDAPSCCPHTSWNILSWLDICLLIPFLCTQTQHAYLQLGMIKTVDMCFYCTRIFAASSSCLLVRAAFLHLTFWLDSYSSLHSQLYLQWSHNTAVSTVASAGNAACVWLRVYKLLMTSSSPSSQASGHVSKPPEWA